MGGGGMTTGQTLRHRIRVHLANQYEYTMKEFCEKLAELIADDERVTNTPSQPREPLTDVQLKALHARLS